MMPLLLRLLGHLHQRVSMLLPVKPFGRRGR
jgi:hypothetical protein